MGDDAHGPFHCPAQECQRDQGDPNFGDAKRFYLHWVSTHKPRCPRTDCKYSLQDLGKSTKSYFLRHWSSHFPDLNTGKSACGKCGREFVNTNNRDRHAAKCESNAAGVNRAIIEATANDLEPDLVTNLTGYAAQDLGFEGRPEANAHWDNIDDLSYDAGPSHLGVCMSSWAPLDEPSLEKAVTPLVPALSLQPTDPIADPENDYTSFEQMLASALPQHPFPVLAADQCAMTQPKDTNALPSSRKRAIEDTATHMSKRHQSIIDRVGNLSESFTCTDPHTEAAEPGEFLFAEASGRTTFAGSCNIPQSFISDPLARAPRKAIATNGVDGLTASASSTLTLPLRPLKQYDLLEYSYHGTQSSQAKHIEVYKKIAAVKTYVRSTSCLQASSYDHYTWIRKLTRKPRKITDATSLLVNDILVSKRTRYPRIINDKSPIFELCATGNYDEVNRHLSLGMATILDVDSQGMTLLHWAAGHWQYDVCQLLLAKGADVEARDWGGMFKPKTPLGIAYAIGNYSQLSFANCRTKHATDTLQLLLESGLDIQASVEIDHALISSGDSIVYSLIPRSIKRAVAQQFSWLARKYILATTCDGLLSLADLHPEFHAGIQQSNICSTFRDEFWDEERSKCELLTCMDIQTFQSVWLYMIAAATTSGDRYDEVSPQFCQSFAGDFHYQQSWAVGEHVGSDSPMQLALKSFAALRIFHLILMASGTDIANFTKVECTMPWCDYTQETLMNFFSLQPWEYTEFDGLFSTAAICQRCGEKFQHKGLMNWEETIELVNSGTSLASLLDSSSEAEKKKLQFFMVYCESCRLYAYTSSESDESEDNQSEDNEEHMGFIEDEVEGDYEPLDDLPIPGMEYEGMEEGTDADPSDESSSLRISID